MKDNVADMDYESFQAIVMKKEVNNKINKLG